MKFIHWEFDENFAGKAHTGIPKLLSGVIKNIDTNKPTGVWFRWTYILQSDNDIFLHCVCEDSYKIQDIPLLSLTDLKLILSKSFENFNYIFLERLDLINLTVPTPIYPITDDMMKHLLEELKK